jgi:uncharacterized protein YndB with AHSA1/START domain
MMTAAPALPHKLDRTVTIQAMPETVFRFFTDSERWAKWWGAGSTVDARPGGEVYIKHPGGVESRGKVVEIDPPRKFVFTYGFESGKPIPSGSSRVTIALEAHRAGTRLTLTHELPDATARDEHIQGWRFQLSLFANIVADEVMANATRYVDLWFKTWSEPDDVARKAMLAEVAATDIRMQDRFSNLDGMDDLLPHLAAAQRFMPGLTMRRAGNVRHCQGMVLADWTLTGLDGAQRGTGTNVFVFAPTGRIEWVTGFWANA